MTESVEQGGNAAEMSREFAPLPDEEEPTIDLLDLLQKLRMGRRTILGWTLCGLLIATAAAYLMPVRYTSAASFVPPSLGGSSSIASGLAGQLAAFGGADLLSGIKSPADLYAGILKSRSISDELIEKEHLMQVYKVDKPSKAETKLDKATEIAVDTKSAIVSVSVTDKSPALAQKLASDYLTALEETNGRLALTQAAQRAKFFGDQLAKEKDALEDAEVAFKETEEQSGLIAPSGQTESEIRTLADTQAQIAARQVELAALRQSATEENPEVIRLRSEVDDLQGQLARLESGSGKSSPVAIPASKVPAIQLEYVRKDREVKYHETLFEILSRQYESARLDEARDAPLLQVLDTPNYPDSKSSPKRLYYVLGGLAAGFLGGCVWVLLREHAQALRMAIFAKNPV